MKINLAHEFYKFAHRRIPLYGILVLLGLMLYTVGSSLRISSYLVTQGFGAGQWATIIIIGISSDMISMEYRDNTMATLMYKTSSKSALYVAKFIVLLVYSAILLVFGTIFTFIIKALMIGSKYSWLDTYHGCTLIKAMLINMVGTMIYLVFIIALALMLILIIKSNAVVIMIVLAIGFTGENASSLALNVFPALRPILAWSPLNMINVITQLSDNSVMKYTYLTNLELIIGNLIYAAIFFYIGLLLFKKQPI